MTDDADDWYVWASVDSLNLGDRFLFRDASWRVVHKSIPYTTVVRHAVIDAADDVEIDKLLGTTLVKVSRYETD